MQMGYPVLLAMVVALGLATLTKAFGADLVVLLRRVAGHLFSFLVRRTMSEEEAQKLIDWYQGDVAEMVAERGSGLTTILRFYFVVWPFKLAEIQRSRVNKK